MKKLTIISLDDWSGIYDNESGQILNQGHSLDVLDVLESMGYTIDYKYIVDPNELDQFGNMLPNNLKELEEYIKENYL